MLREDYELAEELKESIAAIVPLVEMRIYGSRARGDFSKDSDLDVFVEVERLTEEIKEIIRNKSWEIGLKKNIHISPLIFSRDELENTPQRSSSIVKSIMRDGIKI